MSRSQLIALLFGVLLVGSASFARAEDYDDEEGGADDKDVAAVTSANFDTLIKGSKYALVAFTAPWCGHCKKLKPEYARAATVLKSVAPDVVIGNCDATQEAELAGQFDVKGYPTLKWFVDGELASDYNGGRDAEGIVQWIKKKTGPAAVTLETTESLEDMEDDSEVIILGYFSAFEGEAYDNFISVAKATEDVSFAQTTDKDVAAAAGLTAQGVVAIKNFKGDARETAAASSTDEAELLAFVQKEKMPITIEFSQENSEKIFNSGIKKQMLFWASAADLSPESDVFKTYKAVAEKLRGQLVFVTINNEGPSHEPVTNYFGLKDAKSPVILGFYMEGNKKYRFTEDMTVENLEAFGRSVLEGSATPEFKSAPIPENNKDADVTIVVGKTFDSIVKDPSKDVLLEVYAPWCGHCKKLEPVYKKLAKRFKKVDSVVIAKMDGTENEHADVQVEGFPHIVFFPAGEDKTPIVFSGDRSLKAMTKFIKENAAVPYELPKKGGDDKDEL
jgi:protein disulfide-isomerase A1